ncbi:MAG: TVP38/TMEM64 family protein [Bdellovibrionales bacterium]|nr:TVP38/TMEM64 family protein [Bdellovibrionales bacterium]
MAKAKRIGLLLFLLAAIVLLYRYTPARYYLSSEGLSDLKSWIAGTGALAPLIFVALYLAATVFCLPGSILTLVAGALFGTWLGTLYVIVGSNLGANAAFTIARFLGQDVADKFLRGGKLAKLSAGVANNGFTVVLSLRLVPIFPFNGLNYGLGLSPVAWRDYALGSLIGMIPGTFAYVSLGNIVNAVSGVRLTDPQILKRPEVWGPFALILGLTILAKVLKKRLALPSKAGSNEK